VLEFLADLRPESVIAEGAPDHGGDIFRCESDPQIGALGAAIQRHVSDRPKSDVRAQAPAGRWWLNPWLSALRDWICIMRPVSSEPGRTTLGAADAESSQAEWLKKFTKVGEEPVLLRRAMASDAAGRGSLYVAYDSTWAGCRADP
jgi:hypothetical protein